MDDLPQSEMDQDKLRFLRLLADVPHVWLKHEPQDYIGQWTGDPVRVSIVLEEVDTSHLSETILVEGLRSLAEVATIAGQIDESAAARVRELLLSIASRLPAVQATRPTLADLDAAARAKESA